MEYETRSEYEIQPQNDFQPENEIPLIRRHFSSLGWMYFLGTLIIYGVQYAISFLIEKLPFIRIESMDAYLFASMLPMYLIGMPLMGLLIKTVPSTPIQKHKMTFRQWLTAFFMCYAIMYLSNLAGLAVTMIISAIKGAPVANQVVDTLTGISPWTAVFITALCAPVTEELLFRKLLIDRTIKYGEKVSILFSGFIFGMFHGNLNQFAYAFTLGIFFGFIYVKTGKLIYTIVMHMVVNFLSSVAGVFVVDSAAYDELMNAAGDPALFMQTVTEHLPELLLLSLYGLAVLVFFIAGIICLAVNFRKMKLRPGMVSVPKGKLFAASVFNIGMILFTLFWLIMIVLQLLE